MIGLPEITTSVPVLAVVAVISLIFGSVPWGLVMARAFGLGDLRKIGSGNIGATNVLRTGNKLAAALTLILDAAKGAVAVFVARMALAEDAAQVAALFACLGHCYSIFLRFKGGKGVATFLGTVLAIAWPVGLSCCAIWLLVAAITRYSSLSALVAAAASPIAMMVLGHGDASLLALGLATLIFFRHSANIGRLLRGEEPRIGAGAKPS